MKKFYLLLFTLHTILITPLYVLSSTTIMNSSFDQKTAENDSIFIDVIFQVDMSNEIVSAEGISLTGDFIGWGNSLLMSDQGDGIYSLTHALPLEDTILFKYKNGSEYESFDEPTSCTVWDGEGAFIDRILVVEEGFVTPLSCYNSCEVCETEQVFVDITFQVDMSNEFVSNDEVYVIGDFSDWTDHVLMTSTGDGVYSATVSLSKADTIQYKFKNGDGWENIDPNSFCAYSSDGINYNRMIVANEDLTLDVICYNTCEACEILEDFIDVTFQVDISNEVVSDEGVFISGDFIGWGNTIQLNDIGDDIYQITTSVIQNDTIQFKYINGTTYEHFFTEESCLGWAGDYLNRSLVADQDQTVALSCFNSCESCIIEPEMVTLTLQVDLQYEDVADRVYINGSFNDWVTVPMTWVTDQIFMIEVEVEAGSTVNYRFVNGDDWEYITEGGCVDDESIRQITVGDSDIVIDPVCFRKCASYDDFDFVDVTFQVDMSNEEISDGGISLTGDFIGWRNSIAMNNQGDGIYSLTQALPLGDTILFKYKNGNEYESFDEPTSCTVWDGEGAFDDRILVVEDGLVTPLSCYNSCEVCETEQVFVDITFQVDMSNEIVSNDEVFVAGEFSDWTDILMTPIGDAIYSTTLSLLQGDSIEFKFKNGVGWEEFYTKESCVYLSDDYYYNRMIVADEDMTLDVVCYNSCDACEIIENFVDVTFQVDISNEIVSDEGVFISGDFIGWGNTIQLNDIGDDIYQVTVSIPLDDSIQFKYINGADYEHFYTEESCLGWAGDYLNRVLLTDQDQTVDLSCFNSCDDCVAEPEMVTLTLQVDLQYEDVADTIFIAGSFDNWGPKIPMSWVSDQIYIIELKVEAGSTIEYRFVNGVNWEYDTQGECIDEYKNRLVTVSDQDMIVPTACFHHCVSCDEIDIVDVTFQVDLSNEITINDEVYLTGNFSSWTDHVLMTSQGDGTYSTTVSFIQGDTVVYEFINGTYRENILPESSCAFSPDGIYYDRMTVADKTKTLSVVCFESCSECEPLAELIDVTFQVDLLNEIVSDEGISLTGDFIGWSNSIAMSDQGDGIYSLTQTLPLGDTILFKYKNGSEYESFDEPTSCTVWDGEGAFVNRILVVEDGLVTPLSCYNSCENCMTEPEMIMLTLQVDLQYEDVSDTVFINGSFNDWVTVPMTWVSDQIFMIEAEVEAGSTVNYRFVNGDDWEYISEDECVDDESIRQIIVGDSDMVIDPVCFRQCASCDDLDFVDVTFQVDMSNEIVSDEGISLTGDFIGWSNSIPMNANGDGTYSLIQALPLGDTILFKYKNGNEYESFDEPTSCTVWDGEGVFVDRILVVEDGFVTPLSCYNICDACETEEIFVDITFQVDMSNQFVSNDEVYVTGDFSDWTDHILMTSSGDGVYSATVSLSKADTIQYKFKNGDGWEDLDSDSFCAYSSDGINYNRMIVADEVLTLDVVCYNSCDACEIIENFVDVIFQVDMSNEIVSNEGVFISGDFIGWGNTIKLNDIGDDIYQVTVSIPQDDTIQFKYINGTDYEHFYTEESCLGWAGDYLNRSLVADQDQIVALSCFNSCDNCESGEIPVADIYISSQSGEAPLEVTFNEFSDHGITSWLWSFGDGETSTDQNPTHIFLEPGIYMVILETENEYGIAIDTLVDNIIVTEPKPVADFAMNITSGDVPLEVQFTDNSINSPDTWLWNFGDGEASDLQNPIHTYEEQGIYSVQLIVSNETGSDDLIFYDTIQVFNTVLVPNTGFTSNIVEGDSPLRVQFTDVSINAPDSWFWDFGDGYTSTERNPAHTYDQQGVYSVQLITSNRAGADTILMVEYIEVREGEEESYLLQIQVLDGDVPLTDAFVWVSEMGILLTDENGIVEYPGVLSATSFEYSISKSGYYLETSFAQVDTSNLLLSVSLEEIQIETASVQFIIEDEGDFISNAQVNLGHLGTKETTFDGEVSFEDVELGEYIYAVYAEDYAIVIDTIDVTGNSVYTIELESTTNVVTFNVSDNDVPISGAFFVLDGYGDLQTGNDGKAIFNHVLPSATIEYVVYYPPYHLIQSDITVDRGNAIININLQNVIDEVDDQKSLTNVFTIDFNITDGELPIEDAKIFCGALGMYETDGDGICHIENIGAGSTINYVIYSNDFCLESGQFELLSDTALDVELKSQLVDVEFYIHDGDFDLSNVQILLDGYNAERTNENGYAYYDNVQRGASLVYSIYNDGYYLYSQEVITDEDVNRVEVNLIRSDGYDVSFEVHRGDELVQGAFVAMGDYGFAVTDHLGRATFNNIEVGAVLSYKVVATGYNSSVGELVYTQEDLLVDVDLSQELYTVFFVIENSGDKLDGVSVIIDEQTYISDENGAVVINGIQYSDTLNYRVQKDLFTTVESSITILEENTVIQIPLEYMLYELVFNVYDKNGSIDQAMINIDGYDPLYTDDQGLSIFEYTSELDAELLNYSISVDGYEIKEDVIQIVNGGMQVSVEMILMTYQVTFIVSDGSEPLSNATILFGDYGEITTDENGTVILDDVIPEDGISYQVILGGYLTNEGTLSVSDEDVSMNVTLEINTSSSGIFNEIKCYPNPVKNVLTVENAHGKVLEIYTLSGKRIERIEIDTQKTLIDLSNLPSGIYSLRVNGEQFIKLTVQK